LSVKAKIAQPLGARSPAKAVELLALNLEYLADSAIPTQHGMESVIEVAQFQVIRHRHEPDHHWVNLTKNCAQEQSFEGCFRHPPSLCLTTDLVLHSFVCRCLTNPIMLRFHTPLIEPDRRS
jgi:hypothetical protein